MNEEADKLSRKERERLQHREEILDAALRLLVQKGYHNVTMREIAAEAEFATGTLYNFFKSKESLYAELVKTFARYMGQAFLPALDEGDDEREKLSRYVHATVQVVMDNAEAVRLYYNESHGFPDGLTDPDGEVSRLREAVLQKLTEIFEAGVRRGIFRDTPPRLTAACLIGMVECTVAQCLKDSADVPAERIAACVEGVFFRGVLADCPEPSSTE
ncbi:MAG: TetR/AcrR family transcriptional regulator [Phycisphaerae bacterium]|nr:TetR/AcrR family transcriptional regulator [Phycisphaerae bacterium]